MDKYTLSERDICTKFITPALRWAGWDVMSQIRERSEIGRTSGENVTPQLDSHSTTAAGGRPKLSRHSVSLPAKAGHTANPPFGGREEPNATNKRGCGFVGGVPGCVPLAGGGLLGQVPKA